MSITIREVHKCTGCDRVIPDPGCCAKCFMEIESLNHVYFARGRRDVDYTKPDLPDWVYYAGVVLVVALLCFIYWEFAMGGR